MSNLSLTTDQRGIALLTLNRPEVHNAFDDALISSLLEALRRLSEDSNVRVLCLTGAGASFSAGADLHWMRRAANFSEEENTADDVR